MIKYLPYYIFLFILISSIIMILILPCQFPGYTTYLIEGSTAYAQEKEKTPLTEEQKEVVRKRIGRGVWMFKKGMYKKALEEFLYVLGVLPDHLVARYYAGRSYRQLGKFKEATEEFKRILEVRPGSVGVRFFLAQTYSDMALYEDAIDEYRTIVNRFPGTKEAAKAGKAIEVLKERVRARDLFSEAAEAMKEEDYDKALEATMRLLELEPQNIYAMINLGRIYHALGRAEEAISTLKKAIGLSPGHTGAMYQLAVILDELGRYEEAIEQYDAIVATKSKSKWVEKSRERLSILKKIVEKRERIERARILLEEGDLEGALKEAEALVAEEEKNARAHLMLARIYLKEERLDDAIKSLKRAIEIDPSYWEAYLFLGQVYEAKKEYKDAQGIYRAIMREARGTKEEREARYRIKKVEIAVHFSRAKKYMKEGDLEGALNEMGKVLDLAPEDPVAHYNAGVLYDRLDRSDEAESSFKRAIQLAPEYVEAHLQLGLLYERIERFDEAKEEFDKVLSIVKEGREADIAKARLGLIKEEEVFVPHMRKAYRLMNTNRYEEAKKEVETIITVSPDNYIAHQTLGIIYDRLERPEEAIYALKRSIEIKPDNARALLYLGSIYEKESLFREAKDAYRRAMTTGEGTREGEIARIRLKRVKQWKGYFSMGQRVDTNISYGLGRKLGTSSNYDIGIDYYVMRTKKNMIRSSISGSEVIYYESQLRGEGLTVGIQTQVKPLDIYVIEMGGNYTYYIFDSSPSYIRYNLYAGTQIRGNMPNSMRIDYNFSTTHSFRTRASNADRHNISLSISQSVSARDSLTGSYTFSVYVNRDIIGSNYANRTNTLSIIYRRILRPGISASAGYSIGLVNYSNPDSTTLFREFRRNVVQRINLSIAGPLSPQVSMSVGYGYSHVTTNLGRPTFEERQEIEDVLAEPIPLVGGGYINHAFSMRFMVEF